jgi:alkanesulfonate monooxygenase SsuD/methylene tetrahydromethanopterin reductase-like flavin-dependent oxidoreductase (luciferase family)
MVGSGEEGSSAASFDLAAKEAEASFPAGGSAQDVVVWWTGFYLRAGHKRLGRILVAKGKQKVVVGSAEPASV